MEKRREHNFEDFQLKGFHWQAEVCGRLHRPHLFLSMALLAQSQGTAFFLYFFSFEFDENILDRSTELIEGYINFLCLQKS